MLKNLYYQIFDRKKFFSSSNDFKEFENYRIGINTSRTNICITLLFPLMLFLCCFSVLFYNRFKIGMQIYAFRMKAKVKIRPTNAQKYTFRQT